MHDPLSQGIWAPALTPLFPNFLCDHATLISHCFDLLDQGCCGIVLFGTTGEGPSFSVSERIEALDQLISKGFPPSKLMLGNGSSSLADTFALVSRALHHKCAATLISPPSFFKEVQERGVIAFYQNILQKIDSPDMKILLYHIPQYSGVRITMGVIEALHSQFPHKVVGLKESEGNPAFAHQVLNNFPDFQLFVGNEQHLVESVQKGAAGGICGIANLFPKNLQNLYKAAHQGIPNSGFSIADLSSIIKQYPFIAAAKAIMEERQGPSWHSLRPPLVPLDPSQREALFSSLSACMSAL